MGRTSLPMRWLAWLGEGSDGPPRAAPERLMNSEVLPIPGGSAGDTMPSRNERAAPTGAAPRGGEEVTTVELKVWAALVALNGAARSVQRVWPGKRSRKAVRILDGRS